MGATGLIKRICRESLNTLLRVCQVGFLGDFILRRILHYLKRTQCVPETLNRIGQAIPRINIVFRAKLLFLSQESHLDKDNGSRVPIALHFLKSRQCKGNTFFIRYSPLPFLAGYGEPFSAFVYAKGPNKNII
jgi:hypothetical protein